MRATATLILRLLGQALLTLLGASVLAWALLPLAPGDPALRLLQARGIDSPRPAQLAAVRAEFGLDQPLPAQYLQWLGRAARGDLSVSYITKRPVLDEIGKRLPATLTLGVAALLIGLAAAVVAALLSAACHGRWPDRAMQLLTQVCASTPAFLVGLLIIHFLIVGHGMGRVVSDGSLGQVWLPALCLAIGRIADWTQLLRASLLDALDARYTLAATARGASRLRVLLVYALPNAALPFLTAVGVGIGALIGGAPIIEAVFTWPGVGSYVVSAISARDLPVIQGFVVLSALAYVTASSLVDLAGALLDPRIRERTV